MPLKQGGLQYKTAKWCERICIKCFIIRSLGVLIGGERGIRTLDTLLTYTRFPGVLFQPLRHLSVLRATQFEELNNVL